MFLKNRKLVLLLIVAAFLFICTRLQSAQFSQLERINLRLRLLGFNRHNQPLAPDDNNNSNNNNNNNVKVDLDRPSQSLDYSPNVNPLFQEYDEPEGPLVRASDGDGDGQPRRQATFISLVRNSERESMVAAIKGVERTFNHRFHYPWVFFNDEAFTEAFKQKVSGAVSGEVEFVEINAADWHEPDWIDIDKAIDLGQKMKQDDRVQHADELAYKRMCRWNSGKFFEHEAMQKYKYYWRVEPGTQYFCNIDYDVFAYMEDRDYDYGFVLNVYDAPQSVRNLWPTVKQFFDQHPEYLHENNALQWLTQDSRPWHNEQANGYSTCHFWSNFEIGSLDFFRSQKYRDYFAFLDRTGGFMYERWGDAPVHSIALATMTDKNRIHWFRDIGYRHSPYMNCPNSERCRCVPGRFSETAGGSKENCMNEWFKVAGIT